MHEKLEWILNNKEWLFSGAGFVILTWLIKILFWSKKDEGKSNKQKSCIFTIGSNNKTKNKQKNE